MPCGVFAQQGHIICLGHLSIYYRPKRIRTFFFSDPFQGGVGRKRVLGFPLFYEDNCGRAALLRSYLGAKERRFFGVF
jgi:hypothetical protein